MFRFSHPLGASNRAAASTTSTNPANASQRIPYEQHPVLLMRCGTVWWVGAAAQALSAQPRKEEKPLVRLAVPVPVSEAAFDVPGG